MVVAECHITPARGPKIFDWNYVGATLTCHATVWQQARCFAMHEQYAMAEAIRRHKRWSYHARHIGNSKHRQLQFGKAEGDSFAVGHVYANLTEQSQYAAGFAGARRIMVAGHHHDLRIGKCHPPVLQYPECVQYGRVGRAHGVKHVAGYNNELRSERSDLRCGALQGRGDISLPLIHSSGGESLVLPEAQMQIREMYKTHPHNLLSHGLQQEQPQAELPALPHPELLYNPYLRPDYAAGCALCGASEHLLT